MELKIQLTLPFLLVQVLLQVFAVNLDCTPGFQKKNYQVLQSSDFKKDQFILKVLFDDCNGNEGLEFSISNPDFRVEADGSVFAVKEIAARVPGFLIQATSAHAQDLAEVWIVGEEGNRGSVLKESLKIGNISTLHRRKRALIAPPISFPENQRGPFPKVIGRVITDRQDGIKFQLHGKGVEEEPKGVFKINDQSGEIIVTRSLDREEMDMYILQVEITDSTGKLLEGPATLYITIIDQNDNKPLFREGPYVGHVLEASPTGTTVMRMTAFDADDPNTDNAVLRYSIIKQTPETPSPNMFYIDPEKGDIVTVVPPSILDRETLEVLKYELIVQAKDMAGSDVGLTGTATATIIIDDKNDHPPVFTKSMFQATVNEGFTGIILNLTVEDNDDPATGAWRAVYTIINGNPDMNFKIETNPKNNDGMLFVDKSLDYERSAFHTLLIKVENEDPIMPEISYGSSSTTTVQVTVLDANEPPVFNPDPTIVVKPENIAIGSVIVTLNATDQDILQKQTIKFALFHDPAGWLTINPANGTVTTKAALDRESPHVHNSQYTSLFLAIDNGVPVATGTGTLIITLLDVNDNPPSVFPTIAKFCEDTKDVNVAILGATDKDLHPNADPFKFQLGKQPGIEKTWKITQVNSTHAQLRLLQTLKRANYILPIVVTDGGDPPLTNSTDVLVQVCSCKKNKMDCSSANSLHISITLLLVSIITLICL
ncbi:cadherin-13 isoform X1 [Chiloscyllium plagiosum]|uniref:cadherin-13 isoform X1 n=1 Tax=Chiloscyllium plagiosum TaxID=36176 RepID=UPI001CB7D871|nr:cadherin-13 isoform X1 [Chiloscyllium plagiosum]